MELTVPDQRILRGPAATLTATIPDQEGEADASVDSGVTVTITRLDGTTLVSGAAATTVADGVATYTLTAAQTAAGLDTLYCLWSHGGVVKARTTVDVADRYYFSLARLLDVDGVSSALAAGDGDHTNAELSRVRMLAETIVENVTGVSWVRRTCLEYLDPTGLDFIRLNWPMPYSLRSVTVDGTAQTLTDYVLDESGKIRLASGGRIGGTNPRGFVVQYDHGFNAPPSDLVDVALLLASYTLFEDRTSTLSLRATQAPSEMGPINLGKLDRDRPTGIPKIDERLLARRWRGGIGIA